MFPMYTFCFNLFWNIQLSINILWPMNIQTYCIFFGAHAATRLLGNVHWVWTFNYKKKQAFFFSFISFMLTQLKLYLQNVHRSHFREWKLITESCNHQKLMHIPRKICTRNCSKEEESRREIWEDGKLYSHRAIKKEWFFF